MDPVAKKWEAVRHVSCAIIVQVRRNTPWRVLLRAAAAWCAVMPAHAGATPSGPLLDRASQVYILSFAIAAPFLALFHLWRTRRLLRRQSELERQVAEASRAARDAQRAADDATASKTRFLSSMSHQIRTPMSGIIGMTDLLVRTPLSPDQREYADTIGTSGRVLLGIIDDILDLARAQHGEMKIDCAPFDLRRVLEDAVAVVAPAAEHKRLELVLRYPAAIPHEFQGDAQRIRQLALNLLDNAVKFTRHGYVLAEVGAERGAKDGWTVKVAVEDTGTGIADDDRRRLFQEFERLDSARGEPGAGLGLAISRKLVELMGGAVGVESHPAGGSRFWFTLPLRTVREGAGADAVPERPETRALVVAPKSLGRKILCESLADFGIEFHTVESSEDVTAALQDADAGRSPFAAIVLDLAGLGVYGYELPAEIRRNPRFVKTGIILLANTASRGEVELLARRTGSACLFKPVRTSELGEVLAAAQRGLPPPVPVSVPARTDFGRWTWDVLLVEDNAVNQRVAVAQLRSLGCRVDVASTGAEAVERFHACSYDVVFMDCVMPEMDGFEATRRIRELERGRRHTVIVAMTARTHADDRQHCRECGMDDYLPKPVLAEDMQRVLERWRPAMRAPETVPAPPRPVRD